MKWTDEELQILQKSYSVIPINDIVKLIPNHPRQSICRKASYLGLTNFTKNQSDSQKIYSVDNTFFDEPNIRNSYWAGFIAADGYLGKDGNVKITLSPKDHKILQVFKKHVRYNGKIKYGQTKYGKYCKIDLWGMQQWHNALNQNWNIPLKNKTYNLTEPKLNNKELDLAYATGLIDGDGCLYYNNNNLSFGFCGTKKIVLWMQQLWFTMINCKIDFRLNGNSKTNYRIFVYCKNAEKLIHQFKTVNIPWRMKRKWGLID
jgi:hypothetical protein